MTPRQKIARPFTSLDQALTSGHGLIVFDRQDGGVSHADVLARARASGREEDVLLLDFSTRPACLSSERSNTFNPFARADVDTLRQLLASQIEASRSDYSNDGGVFEARALHLSYIVAPVLVWLRENVSGINLDAWLISQVLSYSSLASIAFDKTYSQSVLGSDLVVNRSLGDSFALDVLCAPIRAYIGELGGYHPNVAYAAQKSSEPIKQHHYLMFYLRALSRMACDYANVLGTVASEVEMSDVVSNTRVLVVKMSLIERSQASYEPIVSLILTSLHLALTARLLGERPGSHPSKTPLTRADYRARPVVIVVGNTEWSAVSKFTAMAQTGHGLGMWFCTRFLDAKDRSTRPAGLLSFVLSLNPVRLFRLRGSASYGPAIASAQIKTSPRSSSETAA